jgi:nicotinate-nucleotide--dimethylbenzimidazole phosphoribosyltransferase
LDHLGLAPLLDLGISGGDGSGALAALPLMRMAGALAAATGP